MIFLKTQEEIELLRESNQLVGKTLGEVAKHIRPGISTLELDKIAEDFIRSNGGVPGFLGYGGFPNTLCISVNDEVVHGIPSSRRLEEGDVVSVDCGVVKNGFYGDSAYTFAVGEVSDEVKKLLQVTKDSLYKGIEQAVAGMRIGDIGYAVQSYAEHHVCVGHVYVFFGEMSVWVFHPFFDWFACFSAIELHELFVCSCFLPF